MKNFIKRHKLMVAVIAVGLAVAVIFACMRLTNKDKASYVQVKQGSIVESVYGIGTVMASTTYDLKVGVPSVILKQFVKEGEAVKKGAKLVMLDGMREFYAPFGGTITALPFKEGEAVFAQVPILTLTDFSDRYLVVSLEERGAIRTKRDQKVKISFESLRNQIFEGRVESVYSNADRFLVRIEAPDLPASVLPGMTPDVSIAIQRKDKILLVPVSAISLGSIKVRRGNFGKPKDVPIQTGLIDATMAEVVSGDVKEGDFIVVPKE